MPQRPSETQRLSWYLLLVLPFVGTLWVPFFNAVEPRFGGFPYFYWYQFAWIAVSAVLTGVVYFATREAESESTPRDREASEAARSGFDR
jgi:hypothetical protein